MSQSFLEGNSAVAL